MLSFCPLAGAKKKALSGFLFLLSVTLFSGPGHAGHGQDSRHGVDADARVKGLGAAALAADGKVHAGVARRRQNGDGVLASRQRLEVRGLQVHHDGALFSGVVGLGKGLAVHLHALEAGETGGGLNVRP